jgi:uncharacterized integral membrane protein
MFLKYQIDVFMFPYLFFFSMDNETLTVWRYCFQRILVPCIVIIGVLGNAVSVVVLTRLVMFLTDHRKLKTKHKQH